MIGLLRSLIPVGQFIKVGQIQKGIFKDGLHKKHFLIGRLGLIVEVSCQGKPEPL